VDELEKALVPGHLFLQSPAMRPQPGMQQRPEAFEGVGMHLMKAILIPGMLSNCIVGRFLLKAQLDKPA